MSNILQDQMNRAKEVIDGNSEFFISSHINPDGDSIGSMLALALGLIKKGKTVTVLKNDSIPSDYKFLPGIKLIKELTNYPDHIGVFISLDSGDVERLGSNKGLLDISKNIINIDHHISNTNYGNINIVNPQAAATGEILFEFLNILGIKLDREIAENIYTAISTDTGSFKYESVSGNTHKIISQLIETGINVGKINIELYENISLNRTKLFIEALNSMNSYYKDQVAIVKVTQQMLKDVNASWEDTEGIVSFIRKINTVEVACLLKELKEEEIKVSMRSKEYVDVSSLCASYGGGGHIRAAGCTIKSNVDRAEKSIVQILKDKLR